MSADFIANITILAAFMFGAACLFSLCGLAVWFWQRFVRPPRNRYLTEREYTALKRYHQEVDKQ